jgi:hypothetical protein
LRATSNAGAAIDATRACAATQQGKEPQPIPLSPSPPSPLPLSLPLPVPWLPYPNLGVAELEPPSGSALCGFRSTSDGQWPLTLDCTGHGTVKSVDFVGYGESSGFCGNLTLGSCALSNATAVVEAACLGKTSCTLLSSDAFFGGSPNCAQNATLAVQVTCSDPSASHTYWDFSLIDPMMEDFMNATGNDDSGNSNHSVIINFSTAPQWLYDTGANNRVPYPDDWHRTMWDYERANALRDPTAEAFGAYYGRLLAWYTEGGFTDEAGVVHTSGHHYNISIWECLNELEHGTNVETYTLLYDSMVSHMKQAAPTGTAGMKFMAGALEGDDDNFWTYFFTNVKQQVDYMSFHYYASCGNRSDPANYVDFFSGVDSLYGRVASTIALRDKLAPNVQIDMDELGVILPDDNDAKWTGDAPGFPNVYWNAAAGMYAYEFVRFAALGVEVLGMSQLVGYPELTSYPSEPGFLEPQFPSVAILNWTTGLGTARYWVLKMLIDEFQPGDSLINTTTTTGPSSDPNPFCGSVVNGNNLNLECSDPSATIDQIQFASYGTPAGTCGSYAVGACNAANSTAIVESACLGKNSCSVFAMTPVFGDPCYGTIKYLDVQAHCSSGGGFQPGVITPVSAQAFVTVDGKRKVLVINKDSVAHSAALSGATGGTMQTVDEATGFGPARVEVLAADVVPLAPFAVVLVTMP